MTALVAATATGCGADPQDSAGRIATTGHALAVGCPGGAVDTGPFTFEISKRTIKGRACFGGGPEEPPAVSWFEDGVDVKFDELTANEAEVFRAVHGRIEPALEEAIAASSADALVDVDVWFATNEEGLPFKEQMLESQVTHAWARWELGREVATGAAELIEQVKVATPEVEVVSRYPDNITDPIPRVSLRARPADLLAIGHLPGVVRVTGAMDAEPQSDAGEQYLDVDTVPAVYAGGHDGSGIKVAIYEGNFPNSWANLDGAPAGTCAGRLCACPPSEGGATGDHARRTMSLVRNSATARRGTARGATTLSANMHTTTNCNYTQAANWATTQGASVINRSGCGAAGNPQTAMDRFLDYKASTSPWPTVVGVTGNGVWTNRSCMNLRNGLVVGSAKDNGLTTRHTATMANSTQATNYLGASGWELPHVLAPSHLVDGAGVNPGEVELLGNNDGFSSYAAPQVSGIAADVQQMNPAIKVWPEVIFAGILAGASQNVDAAQGGVWPLSLHDSIDDKDGAGLVSAHETASILHPSLKGAQWAVRGHDYATITAAGTPAGSWYSTTYFMGVPAGKTFRVAAVLFSKPTCGNPASHTNCTGNPYPVFHMYLQALNGAYLTGSTNSNQNYQYVGFYTPSVMFFTVRLYLANWSGLSHTTFGIAWTSEQS